ncbi:ArsR/SmtB family transcription factor [Alkaliphilus serpentinus]|uniref:Winged helix-turn-helix transcriptional regulator n=1 Tax=Alkaliphilus serpentinus TaxID=1482731 RepID=A0A833M7G1_9FIRM|nr:metalloregulator ArsR/SmtB family transcription factor [Alkaliphilus serpentinus]KAB3527607.1 winged helix-turn-helix transcriptional regulator [Alkaliphilus serpentinus]
MFLLKRNPLINFALAVKRLSNLKEYEKDIKKEKFEMDQEVKKIIEEINNQLSEVVSNDLEYLAKKFHIYQFIMSYAFDHNEISVSRFILIIQGFSMEEFKEFYRQEMFNVKADTTIEEIKEKISQHQDNNSISFLPTYKDFLTFEKEIHLIVPRIIQCLEAISAIYEDLNTEIKLLEEKYEEVFKEYLSNQDSFAQQLYVIGKDTYDYTKKDVNVYINIFLENFVSFSIDSDKKYLHMIIGIGLRSRLIEDSQYHLEFFKCLADQTKLNIIEMIASERVCARDIAKRLKLTKATISYHIGKLMMVGILKIDLQEGKKAYYQVQQDIIQKAFDGYMEKLK